MIRKPIRRCHLKLFDIGTKIRELRKERGIIQEQLAKAVGIRDTIWDEISSIDTDKRGVK